MYIYIHILFNASSFYFIIDIFSSSYKKDKLKKNDNNDIVVLYILIMLQIAKCCHKMHTQGYFLPINVSP